MSSNVPHPAASMCHGQREGLHDLLALKAIKAIKGQAEKQGKITHSLTHSQTHLHLGD